MSTGLIQERAICWGCDQTIEYDPIFAAPCDHERCSSAVWHGLCLMQWREDRTARDQSWARWRANHRVIVVCEHEHEDE